MEKRSLIEKEGVIGHQQASKIGRLAHQQGSIPKACQAGGTSMGSFIHIRMSL
jgi:hypothetical protein